MALDRRFVPQIAGGYRGSNFLMVWLWIDVLVLGADAGAGAGGPGMTSCHGRNDVMPCPGPWGEIVSCQG